MPRAQTRRRILSFAELRNDGLGNIRDVPLVRVPTSVGTFQGFRAWALSADRPQDAQLCYAGGEIYIEMVEHDFFVHIPAGATTLKGFREWALSDSFPKRGRISFLGKEIVIDMSPEEIETHLKVKAAINTAICVLDEEFDLGEFFPDGTLVSNDKVGLSTEPDGTFVKWHSYKSGKVRLKPRKDKPGHFMEVIGRPDWVMEIISRWTAAKDTREMADRYHRARIPEYWLIDAQEEEILFKILTYRRASYVEVPPRDGWYKSRVFGCYVRLERKRNRMGRWHYKLQVKPA